VEACRRGSSHRRSFAQSKQPPLLWVANALLQPYTCSHLTVALHVLPSCLHVFISCLHVLPSCLHVLYLAARMHNVFLTIGTAPCVRVAVYNRTIAQSCNRLCRSCCWRLVRWRCNSLTTILRAYRTIANDAALQSHHTPHPSPPRPRPLPPPVTTRSAVAAWWFVPAHA
jgi:hypothetical protein